MLYPETRSQRKAAVNLGCTHVAVSAEAANDGGLVREEINNIKHSRDGYDCDRMRWFTTSDCPCDGSDIPSIFPL